MQKIVYQANLTGLLGRGPHSKAGSGCVLCATYMGLVELHLIDPQSIGIYDFHQKCVDVGAFDNPGVAHDMLDISKAIAPWGARCDDHHVESAMVENLDDGFRKGGVALLRVQFTPDKKEGNHTILASAYADTLGSVACLDSAIGHVTLNRDLRATGLGWGHDKEGKHILHDYAVVNIRRLFRR